MPTSDERQEVAERLRELRHRTYYREEVVEDIIDAISIADPVNTFREPEDIYELLADLIDPTCYVAVCGQPDKYHVCKTCSKCSFGWHEDVYDKNFTFCPNCGARVVSGDE